MVSEGGALLRLVTPIAIGTGAAGRGGHYRPAQPGGARSYGHCRLGLPQTCQCWSGTPSLARASPVAALSVALSTPAASANEGDVHGRLHDLGRWRPLPPGWGTVSAAGAGRDLSPSWLPPAAKPRGHHHRLWRPRPSGQDDLCSATVSARRRRNCSWQPRSAISGGQRVANLPSSGLDNPAKPGPQRIFRFPRLPTSRALGGLTASGHAGTSVAGNFAQRFQPGRGRGSGHLRRRLQSLTDRRPGRQLRHDNPGRAARDLPGAGALRPRGGHPLRTSPPRPRRRPTPASGAQLRRPPALVRCGGPDGGSTLATAS